MVIADYYYRLFSEIKEHWPRYLAGALIGTTATVGGFLGNSKLEQWLHEPDPIFDALNNLPKDSLRMGITVPLQQGQVGISMRIENPSGFHDVLLFDSEAQEFLKKLKPILEYSAPFYQEAKQQ